MLDWTIPGYRALRELGHGARSTTFLGAHEASGASVAMRVLSPELANDEDYLTGYREGVREALRLRSTHIAQIYEHIETDHGVVTIREFVKGAPVRLLLKASPLRPESALAVLRDGLSGLATAHALGMTHPGYRAENLLVDPSGTTHLADLHAPADPQAMPTDRDPREDVRAAFAVFVECVKGKLPRKLRPIEEAAGAGDGAALLSALDDAARASVGKDWAQRARADLTRCVTKAG